MNVQAKAAAYGIAGLALAGILILSGTAVGVLRPSNSGFNPASPGILSILLTDPPSVPEGVTAVYVTYSGLALHATGLGDSGWVTETGQGTFEALGLVNFSQTLSTANVPSGTYNLLAFDIASAEVEFLGANHTATVNNGRLIIPIVGGLIVNSSSPAAAVVDLQPTVLNLGNQSSPDFVIVAGAKAFQVPAGQVFEALRHVGYRFSLAERGWYRAFHSAYLDNLTVSGVALSPSSFNLSLSNSGSDPIVIKLVVLSPVRSGGGPASALASLANSVVFRIGPDGTIQPLGPDLAGLGVHGRVRSALSTAGYEIAGGATVTFSYSGVINNIVASAGITSGTAYYVVVVGAHVFSITNAIAA